MSNISSWVVGNCLKCFHHSFTKAKPGSGSRGHCNRPVPHPWSSARSATSSQLEQESGDKKQSGSPSTSAVTHFLLLKEWVCSKDGCHLRTCDQEWTNSLNCDISNKEPSAWSCHPVSVWFWPSLNSLDLEVKPFTASGSNLCLERAKQTGSAHSPLRKSTPIVSKTELNLPVYHPDKYFKWIYFCLMFKSQV